MSGMPMEIWAYRTENSKNWSNSLEKHHHAKISRRKTKYHHDDKYRALEDEIKHLKIKLEENRDE